MLDVGSSELLLIVIVAVVVIGPKDLPRALYKLGQVLGKARAMSRHFRAGVDAMIREAEMEELEKKWAAENRRIMQEYPAADALPAPGDDEQAAQAPDATSASDATVPDAPSDAAVPAAGKPA